MSPSIDLAGKVCACCGGTLYPVRGSEKALVKCARGTCFPRLITSGREAPTVKQPQPTAAPMAPTPERPTAAERAEALRLQAEQRAALQEWREAERRLGETERRAADVEALAARLRAHLEDRTQGLRETARRAEEAESRATAAERAATRLRARSRLLRELRRTSRGRSAELRLVERLREAERQLRTRARPRQIPRPTVHGLLEWMDDRFWLEPGHRESLRHELATPETALYAACLRQYEGLSWPTASTYRPKARP